MLRLDSMLLLLDLSRISRALAPRTRSVQHLPPGPPEKKDIPSSSSTTTRKSRRQPMPFTSVWCDSKRSHECARCDHLLDKSMLLAPYSPRMFLSWEISSSLRQCILELDSTCQRYCMTARLSVIVISAVLGYGEWLDGYAIIVRQH